MIKFLICLLVASLSLHAADAADSEVDQRIARLEAVVAAQQKQIEILERSLGREQKVTKIAPEPAVRADKSIPPAAATVSNPCEAAPDESTVPAYLRLGSVCAVPVGFMDLTSVWRDKAAGSSLGTNFGSIPYNNVPAAKNSEFRFTPQNSRLGLRLDGNWKGTHFTGYNEFDFLGTSGGNNLGVTNGAFVPRLRLFWVDVRHDKWEFLAGQSWSMLTPNRKGISALPGDLFYSQVVDVNYMVGLTWTRQPGMRILYHPNSKVTAGLSFENPNQYIGGSAGGPGITVPAALSALPGSQLDNATNVLSTPNVHPDIIAKVAFEPSSRVHVEVAGIERTFKIWNPNTNQHFTAVGGGGSINANVEVAKGFRVVTNNYWSDGGGRYLFGQVPDLIVRADGGLSPIHAGGTVDGVEWTVNKYLLYAYYGGIYAGRNSAVDLNGSKVGYGYTGSANSQNRTLQELTFGFNQTLWKNPRYGALNLMGQYEYAFRNPWYVAPEAAKGTHDNTVYVNVRYTLPGDIPKF